MNIVEDKELRRELILDNYQHPMNRGLVEDSSYLCCNTNNESCIDNIDMQLKVEEGVISDIRFDVEACAISTSATSILIKSLVGKRVEDARKILKNYKNMLDEEEYDSALLGELVVYSDIPMQANRIKCALLPYHAVCKMLNRLDEV